MTRQLIKIQYLFHSGFRVEIGKYQLIFDYYQGPMNLANQSTLVFISHSHPDHFNPVVFQWQEKINDINYILSDEIPINNQEPNIHPVSPGEEIRIRDIEIKTYGSTDIGVSFLVRCAGVTLFHAGDLNWWHWWEDSPEEIIRAEELFKKEIARIKGEKIDLAFFPVDPRLEKFYSLGADYFIKEVAPKVLIPMHFGKDTQAARQYAANKTDSFTKIISLTKMGEEIQEEVIASS
ncbi:MBL fold metallo-hydrolase [Dehalobacterium formicoaceticum]|uniref:MBL fold metallo-hydrolase n=1 Tax=Dehalobacterium formicoaceticum TaxID=51515 RepID=A0ABT1YB25_9FIRM|nr:MBL fold metallo-hydrolase [Dehalobacterium formicoaceticum]MCR6546866.1 MBL fold metallo-hydrolase [Dehalobacterium formicoaceticum]